jgi:hypothetical protein
MGSSYYSINSFEEFEKRNVFHCPITRTELATKN